MTGKQRSQILSKESLGELLSSLTAMNPKVSVVVLKPTFKKQAPLDVSWPCFQGSDFGIRVKDVLCLYLEYFNLGLPKRVEYMVFPFPLYPYKLG